MDPLDKTAAAQFPIHDLLRTRWSPRAFSTKPVDTEALQSLLEAARWSASCFNEQPWNFLVATRSDPSEHDQMLRCLVEGNQAWAKSAPVLMISVAKLTFTHNGKPNAYAYHDIGLAVGNLAVQATALGIALHQMAGIHPETVRELYGLPEGYEAVTGIAIGYPGDPDSLSPELQERERAPRSRRALEEFVFATRWGTAASWTGTGQGGDSGHVG